MKPVTRAHCWASQLCHPDLRLPLERDLEPIQEPHSGQRFPTRQRLRTNASFRRVFDQGCRVADDRLCVYAVLNEFEYSRLGLSVGRRWGNAVRRNRIKRLCREAFRLNQPELPQGFDFVLVPRTVERLTLEQYAASLVRLARRAADRLGKARGDDKASGSS